MKSLVLAGLILFGAPGFAEEGKVFQSDAVAPVWWLQARAGFYLSSPDDDVDSDAWEHNLFQSHFVALGLSYRIPLLNTWFIIAGGDLSYGRSVEEMSGVGSAKIEVTGTHLTASGGMGVQPQRLGGRMGGYIFLGYPVLGEQESKLKAQGFSYGLKSEDDSMSIGATLYYVATERLRPTFTIEGSHATILTLGMSYGF